MRNALTVFKREFRSYFDSPVAYVFMVAFLALAGFLTFSVAMFYERRQADLTPFFFWHPWIYLLLVPAATMGSWADERRNGTAELLLTLPLTLWEALVGKFLAAWAFIALALACTFPVALTAAYLGSPDWGAIACGYLGSLLLAGAATAIGVFASALSRSQVIAFVIALALTFVLLLVGFDPVVAAVTAWGVPTCVTDALASCSLLSHFEALRRAVIDFADLAYYLGMIVFMLTAAKFAAEGRRAQGAAALALVAVSTGAVCILLSSLSLRLDCTAERLYTLSGGSKAVLAKLDRDVTIKCFFSASSDETPMALKTYANEVMNLLREYELAGGGRLAVESYDPKPDSDAEEWAQRYGIEPQAANPLGAGVYFGLVAVSGGREETLPRLSPRTQSTLEYDVTRLVTRVAWPERPVVGVMSSLPNVMGGRPDQMAMMRGQRPEPGWAAFSELAKDYEVREIATDAEQIDAAVKTLVVVHPKNLGEKTLFAIDQFVIGGGRLIACVDPVCAVELMSGGGQNPMMMGAGGSTLGKLFDAWGISFDATKVVADLSAATRLGTGDGRAEQNPAFLSLGAGAMAKDDLLVSRLSQVMLPFAGAFSFKPVEGLTFEPLMSSSSGDSCLVEGSGVAYGMGAMGRELKPDGEARVLAARLSGTFKTAFPKGPDWREGSTNAIPTVVGSGKGTVALFGDADFLADNFCVRAYNTPFGRIAQPINDNLVLFANLIERFAGREELIGVRSRTAADRPFAKVNELEAQAMARWQRKEQELRGALEETQRRLGELQSRKSGGDRMILSREQQQEIAEFRRKQAETRRELKNVRRELTAGIDRLGHVLKALNIVGMPLLLILFGVARGCLRRRASRARR